MKMRLLIITWIGLGLLMSRVSAQTATLTSEQTALAPSGGQVVLTATADYAGLRPAALGWVITLPSGWALVAVGGDAPTIAPPVGTTGEVEFAYLNFPAKRAQFTVTLSYPASGVAPVLRAACTYRSPLKTIAIDNIIYTISPAAR